MSLWLLDPKTFFTRLKIRGREDRDKAERGRRRRRKIRRRSSGESSWERQIGKKAREGKE